MTLYQDGSSLHDMSKNMASRGRGLFSVYIEFSHVRRQFFQTNDLRYLFENVSADNILVFLKHINLFNKV